MNACLEPAFDKVFDTQRIYRLMLDALARPGKLRTLPGLDICPPNGLNRYAAGLGFTLLDSETTFAILPEDDDWRDYFSLNTGVKPAAPEAAEFILLRGGEYLPEIARVNRGTLLSPEEGSTLFVLVDAIGGTQPGAVKLTLAGPGIKELAQVAVVGLHPLNLAAICSRQEYPLGVDCFFVDAEGIMLAMPRSATVQWEEVPG